MTLIMILLQSCQLDIAFEHAHADCWLYHVDRGSQGRASDGRYYWKPDLCDMIKKITELEEDRDAGYFFIPS